MTADNQTGGDSARDYKQSLEKLASHPALAGLELSSGQWDKLEQFCLFLADYNEKVNLVSNTSAEVLVNRHVLDGLTVAANIHQSKMTSGSLIDIGSGGGLPAMIVAIACPDLQVTMVDSVGKKVKFLEEASNHLGLTLNRGISGRAEELARVKGERESYDLATARAVGTLTLTLELCLPFLKRNGLYLAQKTTSRLDQELVEAKAMMRELECRVEQTKTFENMPGVEESVILLIRKLDRTPHYYPRPWAKIKATK
jgi:16S rRNA (guanine527-N7)-methyltransferase